MCLLLGSPLLNCNSRNWLNMETTDTSTLWGFGFPLDPNAETLGVLQKLKVHLNKSELTKTGRWACGDEWLARVGSLGDLDLAGSTSRLYQAQSKQEVTYQNNNITSGSFSKLKHSVLTPAQKSQKRDKNKHFF